jgi:diguanylate cyclase (GGDEF)-like protein
VLDAVKHDRAFGHLPVMIVLDETTRASISWASAICDDYLIRPLNADELLARVALCIARSHRDVNANPLTGLPGNLTIMREAARRLESGDPFAMGYVDLDHFKAFNDKYGFERGDQVLRMAARVLVNAVNRLGIAGAYVGHVGGDDFILMVPSAHTTQACAAIIRDFDTIVRDFYDDEDREAGEIRSKDRQGNPQTFPLMSCSIAVVDTESSDIRHVGELSARAAEVKKEAKRVDGSTYMIDRRG